MIYLYVGIGGIIGSLARFLVSLIPIASVYPVQTFAINLTGSFILGFLTIYFKEKKVRPEISAALGTGVIGSFTTLSTFSVDTLHLLQSNAYLEALLYIAASMALGLLAAFFGMHTAMKRYQNRARGERV